MTSADPYTVDAPPDEDWVYLTFTAGQFAGRTLRVHRSLVVDGWPADEVPADLPLRSWVEPQKDDDRHRSSWTREQVVETINELVALGEMEQVPGTDPPEYVITAKGLARVQRDDAEDN